ncbi:MAG: hypothetical protein Q8P86_02405 [bacterium]|nr:hypothetical protein [bacterium]
MNLSAFVEKIVDIINILIPFVVGLTVFVLTFGIFRYISMRGSEDAVKRAKDLVLYGVIAVFVALSVWGIVTIIKTTVFPS